MNDTLREARNSALTLLAFAVIATALMAGVYALTYKTVRSMGMVGFDNQARV